MRKVEWHCGVELEFIGVVESCMRSCGSISQSGTTFSDEMKSSVTSMCESGTTYMARASFMLSYSMDQVSEQDK